MINVRDLRGGDEARSQCPIGVVTRKDPAGTNIRDPPTTNVFDQKIYSKYTDINGMPPGTIELEPEVPAAAIATVMENGPPVLKDLARRESFGPGMALESIWGFH